ncbi:MAG TPA: hypothetical protein VN739_01015, partial [Nitrososphaerales archaeon]|nr:hypothetical protein [Nitrososphaerales archaeon]
QNAKAMFRHAAAAQATSKSKMDIPYAIGLMIQLRITPFLIKTKQASVEDLAKTRNSAIEAISIWGSASRDSSSRELSLVFDGLGFSFFLFERDIDKALVYLTKAEDQVARNESKLSHETRRTVSSEQLRTERRFYSAISSVVYWDLGICYEGKAELAEGEQMMALLKTARSRYQLSFEYALKSSWHIYKAMSAYNLSGTYFKEGSIQIERKKAIRLLKRSVEIGEVSLRWFNLWSSYEGDFLGGSWIASFYQHLANYSTASSKEKLMRRSLQLAEKADILINNRKIGLSRYKAVNVGDIFFRNSEYNRQQAVDARYSEKSPDSDDSRLIGLLDQSLVDCLKSRTFYRDPAFSSRKIDSGLLAGDICYELMSCKTQDEQKRRKYSAAARRYFHGVTKISKGLGLNESIASSCWRIAQVLDKEGRFSQSEDQYRQAHDAFELVRAARSDSPVYAEFSKYMLAWCNIENAKIAHKISNFEEASRLYKDASSQIRSSRRWSPRSHLYTARAFIEEAEMESLTERTAMIIDRFSNAKHSLQKLELDLVSDDSIEGKSFIQLGKYLSSFCDARIILERSKEAFRIGDIPLSVSGLEKSENIFSKLSKEHSLTDPIEGNELMSLASLCRALNCFQRAQITGDLKLYLEARDIFSSSAENSKSKTLKPFLRGLASFATFLYSSKQIEESLETSLDIERLSECQKSIDLAESHLAKFGNKSFLNMLRASKNVLDASIAINAAEREVEDQDVKSKLFAKAQHSLSLASRKYEQLGSSDKLKESLRLLSTVKQNRELIPLANKVFAEIASNQIIFSAISSSSVFDQSPENSARQIDSSFVILDVSLDRPVITVKDNLTFSISVTNIGKESAVVTKIQDTLPNEFESLNEDNLDFKDGCLLLNLKLDSGASKTVTILARSKSIGEFVWHPAPVYLDAQGNYKVTKAGTLRAVVEESDLSNVTFLRLRKEQLEAELSKQENSSETSSDEIFSLKDQISRIEEELHRSSNEYDGLITQLRQVHEDLIALNSIQDEALKQEEKTKLETEERILADRIERRRSMFQQEKLQ